MEVHWHLEMYQEGTDNNLPTHWRLFSRGRFSWASLGIMLHKKAGIQMPLEVTPAAMHTPSRPPLPPPPPFPRTPFVLLLAPYPPEIRPSAHCRVCGEGYQGAV